MLWPAALSTTSNGEVLLADSTAARIQRWALSGAKTKLTYDADGNLESLQNPDGAITHYQYDAAGQQIRTLAANGATQETEYGPEGQVSAQIDAKGNRTEYKRNTLGQIEEVIDPLGNRTRSAWDLAGNLISFTNAEGQSTSYEYNADDQPSAIAYSDGKTHGVQYEYNQDGYPIKMTDASGSSTFAYDQLDLHLPSYRGHIHYEEIHMAEKRRKFDQDFRDGAVRIVLDSGRPIAEVAREMGIDDGTLGNWVKKAREKHKPGALKEDERSELNRLRREVKELRMQRDVLKRSVVLWVDEAMGRTR